MTAAERQVMEHATAWTSPERLYRNHFAAGPNHDDWTTLQSLCAQGLMFIVREPTDFFRNMTVFGVTDAGIAELKREES